MCCCQSVIVCWIVIVVLLVVCLLGGERKKRSHVHDGSKQKTISGIVHKFHRKGNISIAGLIYSKKTFGY